MQTISRWFLRVAIFSGSFWLVRAGAHAVIIETSFTEDRESGLGELVIMMI